METTVTGMLDCVSAVRNFSQERYRDAVFSQGEVSYQSRPICLRRPARGTATVEMACPVCAKPLEFTVWSLQRLRWHRIKAGAAILVSIPFLAILFGLFTLVLSLMWMFGAAFRRGLFLGTNTSLSHATPVPDDNKLLFLKHRLRYP